MAARKESSRHVCGALALQAQGRSSRQLWRKGRLCPLGAMHACLGGCLGAMWGLAGLCGFAATWSNGCNPHALILDAFFGCLQGLQEQMPVRVPDKQILQLMLISPTLFIWFVLYLSSQRLLRRASRNVEALAVYEL